MLITITWLVVATVSLMLYLHQVYTKMSRAGLNHLPVVPFFGHIFWQVFNFENFGDTLERCTQAFPDDKIIGHYEMLSPMYLVKDVETIKKVTIKEFDHFVDRKGAAPDSDYLFGRSLLSLRGDDWKEMRSSLSTAFTSSKIRLMLPFIVEIGEQMINVLRKRLQETENGYMDIEIKDLFTRYANDVIASCAFGLKMDSQTDNNEFYIQSNSVIKLDFKQMLKLLVLKTVPSLCNMFDMQVVKADGANYIKNVVLRTMKEREMNKIVRHDMIHILNELKKGNLKQEEEVDDTADFATVKKYNVGKKKMNKEWTDRDLVAQAAIFLFAGFETISTTLTFTIYELASHSDIQDRLAKEIREHDERCDGKFDFNSIHDLKYLDMVVSESLRLYPPTSVLDRVCVKDFNFGKVNNTSDKDLIVRKGEVINYPIWAFHRDPKLFPEPHKFDPERFSDENKHKIQPFSYMPFGLGPRNCIASRFALYEVKVILYQLIRDMQFFPCEKTLSPTVLNPGLTLTIKNGAWVRIRARQ